MTTYTMICTSERVKKIRVEDARVNLIEDNPDAGQEPEPEDRVAARGRRSYGYKSAIRFSYRTRSVAYAGPFAARMHISPDLV
jgi:hypothetical protein